MSEQSSGGRPRRAAPRRSGPRTAGVGSYSGTQHTPQRPLRRRLSPAGGPARARALRRRRITVLTGALACAVTIAVAGQVGAGRIGDAAAPGPAATTAPASTAGAAAGSAPTSVPTSEPTEGTEATIGPERVQVDDRGPGEFRRAVVSLRPPSEEGRLLRYAVKIEKGLPFDREATARQIAAILNDRRGWSREGKWRFQLVGRSTRVDFTVLIATPTTTDRRCAPLLTWGRVSCQAGPYVVLNARRWAYGIKAYDGDVDAYRTYLVNHEVGHRLGLGHVGCPGAGRKAPVMMQQTKGLHGCRPNPWP